MATSPVSITDVLLAFLLSLPILHLLARLLRLPSHVPLLGTLPAAVSNLHRLHDFTVDLLLPSPATSRPSGLPFLSHPFLLTADPANIHHIFTSNFPNYPKGPAFSDIFDVLGNGIFNSDSTSWKLQRKLAHEFMSSKSFRIFVAETTELKLQHGLLPLLSRACEVGSLVDLQDLFLRFTFDTTCVLVMGVDPGCLSLDLKKVPFADAMDDAEEIILRRHLLPMSCWKLLRWLGIGWESRMKKARQTIDSFISAEIEKKKNNKKPSPDLLTSYLDSAESNSEMSRSAGFLRDTAVNLLIAGRDTTAAGLSWFFYLIARHPHVEERIIHELSGADRRVTAVYGGELAVFEPQSVSRLTYLHAALLETLRLYPPVPFEHKRVAADDELPSGHAVQEGTEILVSVYAMARMEGVWGEDCAEFRPERWISDKGRLRHEPSYKFMAFNSGPRTCLGRDTAMVQMKVAAATVLWNFTVEVAAVAEVRPKVSIILHMKDGLKVYVRRRSAKATAVEDLSH